MELSEGRNVWCQEEKSGTVDGVQLSPSHKIMDKGAKDNDLCLVLSGLRLLHGLDLQEGDERAQLPIAGVSWGSVGEGGIDPLLYAFHRSWPT